MAPKKQVKAKKPVKPVKPVKKSRKAAPRKKAVPALQCGICGYRIIIDQTCGCIEEHVLLCCGQPMGKIETAI